MGLVIILVMGLYLLIAIGVVSWAISYAKKNGKRVMRWGWGAAFIMFLIPFWDWIPTVVMHKYYCSTEAGFWVYKTLDEWEKENPGVMGNLHQILQPIQKMPYGYLQILDERFAIEIHRKAPIPFLSTKVDGELLVDIETGEILAKSVNIGSGVGSLATNGGLKFWLNQEPCISKGFSELTKQLESKRGE